MTAGGGVEVVGCRRNSLPGGSSRHSDIVPQKVIAMAMQYAEIIPTISGISWGPGLGTWQGQQVFCRHPSSGKRNQ